MIERSTQFTEELFKKHLRFLTKEYVEEKMADIRDEPNLFAKKDQLMDTQELDQKVLE